MRYPRQYLQMKKFLFKVAHSRPINLLAVQSSVDLLDDISIYSQER